MTKKNLVRAVSATLLVVLAATVAVLSSDRNSLAASGRTLAAKNAVLVGENARFVAINRAANERAATAEAQAKKQANRIIARERANLDRRASALEARTAKLDTQAKQLAARAAELDALGRELDSREAAVTALEEERSSPEEFTLPEDSPGDGCHPSYEGACLDQSLYDYDCEDGSGDGPGYTGYVTVVGPDEYGLDGNGDGEGCE